MILLCLDVSSTATGWAVFRTEPRLDLLAFSIIKPGSRDNLRRMDAIRDVVLKVAAEHDPNRVVMEWSAGKVHRRMKRIHGLATLGQAQGVVRQSLLDAGYNVSTVSENDWTGGTQKERRARVVELEWPDYRAWARKDRGRDVADAIGVGQWWWRKHKFDELLRAAQ